MDPRLLRGLKCEAVTTTDPNTGLSTFIERWVPGDIIGQWAELIRSTDPLQRRKKEGVRFAVRSADELIDKLRAATNALGILIYPSDATNGKGLVVEGGTMADVNMVLIAQSVTDGSMLAFGGYGQGSDQQDKAGGKAMTYAHKAILIQAALLGGTKTAKALGVHDTDDSSDPIPGGVKPKAQRPVLAKLREQLGEVTSEDEYNELRPILLALTPEDQGQLTPDILKAKERAGMPLPKSKEK